MKLKILIKLMLFFFYLFIICNTKVYNQTQKAGELIWRYKTGHCLWSSPEVVDGVLYVGSLDKNIYALNAKNGELIWRYRTGL